MRVASILVSLLLTSCVHEPKAGRAYTGPVAFSIGQADQTVRALRADTNAISTPAVRKEYSQGLDAIHNSLTTAVSKLSVATTRIDQDAGLIASRDATISRLQIYRVIVWTVALGAASVILLPLILRLIKFIP
jgi:hypothetical protein